jgi:hypothetical protein
MNKKSCSKSSCSTTAPVPVLVSVPVPVPAPAPAPVPTHTSVCVRVPVCIPTSVPVSKFCDGDEVIENEADEQIKESSHKSLKSMKPDKVKGSNWTDIETSSFIALCIEKRIIKLMDGKRHKHIDIYKSLEPNMKEMGFIKTGAQMKTKMKHLKEAYFKCKRNNSVSGADRISFSFYDEMDQLLGGRPSVEAINNHGIDSFSAQDDNIRSMNNCLY